MSFAIGVREHLSTLQNLDPQKNSVAFDANLHLTTIDKRSGFCNFVRWVIYLLTFTLVPRNPALDKVTLELLKQINENEPFAKLNRNLVEKAFTNLLIIINYNGGGKASLVRETMNKIKKMQIVIELGGQPTPPKKKVFPPAAPNTPPPETKPPLKNPAVTLDNLPRQPNKPRVIKQKDDDKTQTPPAVRKTFNSPSNSPSKEPTFNELMEAVPNILLKSIQQRQEELQVVAEKIQGMPPVLILNNLFKNHSVLIELFPRFNSQIKSKIVAKALTEALLSKNNQLERLLKIAAIESAGIWKSACEIYAKTQRTPLSFKSFKESSLISLPAGSLLTILEEQLLRGNPDFVSQFFTYLFSIDTLLETQKDWVKNLCLKAVLPKNEKNANHIWLQFMKALASCEANDSTRNILTLAVDTLIQQNNKDVVASLTEDLLSLLPCERFKKDDPDTSLWIAVKTKQLQNPDLQILLKELFEDQRFHKNEKAMGQFISYFKDEEETNSQYLVDLILELNKQNQITHEFGKHLLEHVLFQKENLLPLSMWNKCISKIPYTIIFTYAFNCSVNAPGFLKLLSLLSPENASHIIRFFWQDLLNNEQDLVSILPFIYNPNDLNGIFKKIFKDGNNKSKLALFTHLEKAPWKILLIDPTDKNFAFPIQDIIGWLEIQKNLEDIHLFPICLELFKDLINLKLDVLKTMQLTKFFKIPGHMNPNCEENFSTFAKEKLENFTEFDSSLQNYLLVNTQQSSTQDLNNELFHMHPSLLVIALQDESSRKNIENAILQQPLPDMIIKKISNIAKSIQAPSENQKEILEKFLNTIQQKQIF